MEITRDIAVKVLQTVDAGLVAGIGRPVPGAMCVEAAVCYAMGLPHSDEPTCVSPALRVLKIRLNDSDWSSNQARAKGMRRLALIQLGSAGALDDAEFAKRVVELVIRKQVPAALRADASVYSDSNRRAAMLVAAGRCAQEGTLHAAKTAANASVISSTVYATSCAIKAAAYADRAAAATTTNYAAAHIASAIANATNAVGNAAASVGNAIASSAACDKVLGGFAEDVVKILVAMSVPGSQWLDLAPLN